MNDKKVIQRLLKAGRALGYWSKEFIRASEVIEKQTSGGQNPQARQGRQSGKRREV